MTTRVLLEGPPGIGKTTVVAALVDLLRARGVPVSGFLTRELRESGRRVGFQVASLTGDTAVLAHVGFEQGQAVGRYRVDVAALERVALPALEDTADRVLIVDELGRMELASPRFGAAVKSAIDLGGPVVATVHLARHPVTDALKARPDLETIPVTVDNRAGLPQLLAARLTLP